MRFGGTVALNKVSLILEKGHILGLIGPNGSGKSTLFNVATGFYRATAGSIFLNERNLTDLYAYEIAKLGLSRTFQNLNLFKRMTVLENIMVGMHAKLSVTPLDLLFRLRKVKEEEQGTRNKAQELLVDFGLDKYATEQAENLPYGIQKWVEIARALAANPQFLLLDEPAAGLNATETNALRDMIHMILEKGIAILLVEHNMQLVMNVCPRIVVLNYGKKIAEGTPTEIRENQAVVEAYLGKKRT